MFLVVNTNVTTVATILGTRYSYLLKYRYRLLYRLYYYSVTSYIGIVIIKTEFKDIKRSRFSIEVAIDYNYNIYFLPPLFKSNNSTKTSYIY